MTRISEGLDGALRLTNRWVRERLREFVAAAAEKVKSNTGCCRGIGRSDLAPD